MKKMNHPVTTINLGFTNCYLIKGNRGSVLIDAGRSGKLSSFIEGLKRADAAPQEVSLIIITHAHFDHTGSLAEIKRLTGAETAASQPEANLITKGKVILPAGTNFFTDFLTRTANRHLTGIFAFEKSDVEHIITGETDLSPWGISGRILPTPGHTTGSISVILNDGRAFVGDCMANFPFAGKVFPPFADDVKSLMESWKMLIDTGSQKFFPAHGGMISLNQLKKVLYERIHSV